MNKKLLMCSVVCSLIAIQSLAADNVYVDLSVLDNISQDSIGFVRSSPAFPEVKKVVVQPHKKTAQIVKKTPVSEEQKKKESSIVEVKPMKPLVIESPEENLSNEDQTVAMSSVIDENKEIKNEVLPQETVANEEEKVSSDGEENRTVEPVTEQSDSSEEASVASSEQMQDAGEPISILPQQVEQSEQEAQSNDGKILSAKVSDENGDSQNTQIIPREIYSVSFAPDSSELSEDSTRYLDEVITKFDKDQKKKISIKAYNYDNGEDSFRKKRVSLIRATQVRSYLLNRGFKDFSIKIINTTADSDDRNSVEIEELN